MERKTVHSVHRSVPFYNKLRFCLSARQKKKEKIAGSQKITTRANFKL